MLQIELVKMQTTWDAMHCLCVSRRNAIHFGEANRRAR